MGTPGAFEAAERVVGVTTHSPPSLVILARPSLCILHVFPATGLTMLHPPSISDAGAGIRTLISTLFPPYPSSPPSASVPRPSPTSPTSPPGSHTPRTLPVPTPISAVHSCFLAPSSLPTIRLLSSIRSAPAASALLLGGNPPSGAGSLAGGGNVGGAVGSVMGVGSGGAGRGSGTGAWVRVVDLGPLLGVGSSTKVGRGGTLQRAHV
ncbi:hypothetical protein K438DRAFT_736555 [Mycena galopus ATCC 62051]|nr:hypothetical protein K438DRAFT_736555 [Mycena galopus ATCC 62051]